MFFFLCGLFFLHLYDYLAINNLLDKCYSGDFGKNHTPRLYIYHGCYKVQKLDTDLQHITARKRTLLQFLRYL